MEATFLSLILWTALVCNHQLRPSSVNNKGSRFQYISKCLWSRVLSYNFFCMLFSNTFRLFRCNARFQFCSRSDLGCLTWNWSKPEELKFKPSSMSNTIRKQLISFALPEQNKKPLVSCSRLERAAERRKTWKFWLGKCFVWWRAATTCLSSALPYWWKKLFNKQDRLFTLYSVSSSYKSFFPFCQNF